MATTNDKQVIFSLVNVGKVYPPKRQVLREIYLGFYYGAKIGVLGLNGSGKSSLLKIIAGVDQNYTGEISRSKGYSVGLLEQQPQLQEKIEAANGWELEHHLDIAMDALRCPPSDQKVDTLSGGEKRRVAL